MKHVGTKKEESSDETGGAARAKIRTSAWTPVAMKVGLGLVGFAALALVGSGAAADLLPKNVGTYLGPPAPSASSSAAPSASAAPTPSAKPIPSADAGAPNPAPSADASTTPTASAVTSDGRVILNLAAEEDLRKLPGIGATRAKAILALRGKLGKFTRPEDLLRVKGIGRRSLARLRPKLLVDPPKEP